MTIPMPPRLPDTSRPSSGIPRGPLRIFVVALLLLIVIPWLLRLYVDWLWFGELGYRVVLQREIATRLALFATASLLTFAFLHSNSTLAQRGLSGPLLLRDAPEFLLDLVRRIPRLATPFSIAVALLVGLSASSGWLATLRFLWRTPFGVADPVFGRDVSFYVFVLPVLQALFAALITLLVLALVMAAGIYLLRGDIFLSGPRFKISRRAALHLGILLAALFLLAALQIWAVHIPSLLFSTTGPFVGASYTDLNARLPGLRVTALAAIAAAGLVLFGLVKRRLLPQAPLAVAGFLVVSALARGVYPALVQRFVVAPTELTREKPYLARHIEATRRAWGIDSVETRDLSGEATLTMADIRANGPTIENVRLWDREPLLQTFGQLQEIRTYYDFISVDDDRYWIDGRYRQVLLSARELNTNALPTRSFINDHLTYTHGMGITMAPVNQVTAEGLPVLFIKDLPPSSTVSIQVTRPQLYFGELTNFMAIVGSRQPEFDYPSGSASVYTGYTGKGGVRVGSLWRRALLAWYFGSLNLLLSGDIVDSSRILFRRNIVERASRALPFVQLDQDPYLVVSRSGELKWFLDAYTRSERYPYAQRLADGTTYMRNAVKIVIDAYDGTLSAYVADPRDPIVRALAAAFPGVLLPMDSMPADIRAHIRYPEDLYRAQAALYAIYHMTEPEQFYHREDQWQMPVMEGVDARRNPFMRHIVMRLPDEAQAEFIFMTPYTPRQKDNLAAWMVARNDGEHYGKLRVYRFPKQSLVFGPRQIVNRINQDTEISRQITLWDQRGSEVIRGQLLVIPIEESLIYVQPLYLRAQGGQIPELKRVVLAYQNRVVMEETLDAALVQLFGSQGETPARQRTAEPQPPEAPDILRQIAEHYERALAAQRAGNWATYGAEMERIGELLRRAGAGRVP
jgi:uncharacterized membrane protein (UPF0182 family)